MISRKKSIAFDILFNIYIRNTLMTIISDKNIIKRSVFVIFYVSALATFRR